MRFCPDRCWSLAIVLGLACMPAFTPCHAETPVAMPPWEHAVPLVLGRSDAGTPLQAWHDPDALKMTAPSPLVVLVVRGAAAKGKEDHSQEPLRRFMAQLRMKSSGSARVLMVHVDSAARFPPHGSAYNTDGNRTAATLWRALGWLGPDLVIEVADQGPVDSLAAAVRDRPVAEIGTIPSMSVPRRLLEQPWDNWTSEENSATGLLEAVPLLEGKLHSSCRQELLQRAARTPSEVATQLAGPYGHALKTVMYQPALAIVARLKLAETVPTPGLNEEVANILEPHLALATASPQSIDGQPAKAPGASEMAGHLIFADWALRTGDHRSVLLVKQAADYAFDSNGRPLPAMPAHSEMSDSVFMVCPLLTSAARLTGDPKYIDMALRHLRFMQKLCVRPDGIYRHSPLCEAAWGRGNGFPMLGLALALTDLEAMTKLPQATPEFKSAARQTFQQILADFRNHAQALLPHQDATGMWRQVIDEPSAYREMTATCMIGFALQRGIGQGWLDRDRFGPAVDRAWQAAMLRMASDGVLLDVCTGTGKQKTLQDYFDREAILGRDERGGAMSLLFAVERIEN